jgi:hypothetical protein
MTRRKSLVMWRGTKPVFGVVDFPGLARMVAELVTEDRAGYLEKA